MQRVKAHQIEGLSAGSNSINVADYGAVGDGATDDTAAINAAVAAAVTLVNSGAAHVIIQFDAKEYLLTSAPTHPDGAGGAYAQIPLPKRATTATRAVIEFRGVAQTPITPNEGQAAVQKGGTILRSTSTATRDATYGVPSVIGGPAIASSGAGFTNVNAILSGLTIRRPDNPSIAGADFTWCLQAKTRDCVFDTNVPLGSITYPTSTSNIALLMPEVSNNALSSCEGDLYVMGAYAAVRFSEHFTLNHLVAYKNKIAMIPAVGYHGSIIQHANCEWQTHVIADLDWTLGPVDVGAAYLSIDMLDIEDAASGSPWAPVNHVKDANNALRMLARFVRVLAGVGTQAGLTVVGGGKVHTVDVGAGAGWGGASALTVKDEGVSIDAAVASINVTGTGVTATTDGAGHVTLNVPGAAGAGAELLMQDGVTGPPVPLETEGRDDWLYQG